MTSSKPPLVVKSDDATEIMRVDTSGKIGIGIGTTAPVSLLQLGGDLALEPIAFGSPRALPAAATMLWNDGRWLRLNQNLDYSKPIFGVHTPGVFAPGSLNVGGANGWGDPGGGNAWFTGSVGIGTTSPSSPSEVLTVSNGGILINAANDTSTTPALTLNSNDTWSHGSVKLRSYGYGFHTDPQSTNAGLYLSGWGGITMYTGNDSSNVLEFTQGGNVGIGTSQPDAKLTVAGDITTTGTLRAGGITTGTISAQGARTYLQGLDGANYHWIMAGGDQEGVNNAIGFSVSGSNNCFHTGPGWSMRVRGDLALDQIAPSSPRSLPVGGTMIWNDGRWLRLNQNLDYSQPTYGVHTPGVFAPGSLNVGGANGWGDPGGGNAWFTGSVGIGTTTPARKLHVENTEIHSGGSGAGFSFGNRETSAFVNVPGSGERWVWYSLQGTARLWSGSDKLAITSAGNVGIGTTTPDARLTVTGTIAASGDITTPGTLSAGTLQVAGGITTGGISASRDITTSGTLSAATIAASRDITTPGTLRTGHIQVSGGITTAGISCSGAITTLGAFAAATIQTTWVSANNSTGTGVYGKSTNGNGVLGESTNSDGVFGISSSTGNAGVHGANTSGVGVWGSSRDNDAILGTSEGSGNAGTFGGNVYISGNLWKGSGGFRIDHPLDPANKYLSHSFVESPNMLNVYNGNVTTDANGDAAVTLPDYFEALNQDFRYQLTVIGQFAQAIVAGEISNNQFTIKTDKPHIKVSWQVTGSRKDAWAQANPPIVEEEKSARERDHYLHPEVYGHTLEKSVISLRHPEVLRRLVEKQQKPSDGGELKGEHGTP